MGIKATGDPLWWDGLTTEQQDAVLGMMWREAKDEEEEMREAKSSTRRNSRTGSRQPIPPPPSNATPEAWANLVDIARGG